MSKLLTALALVLAVSAHASEIRLSVTVPGTKDSISVYPQKECRSEKVKQLVRAAGADHMLPQLQHAETVFAGKNYEACFMEVQENIVVIYEDDQVGVIPKQLFVLYTKI